MENLEHYRIPLENLKRICDCESELNFCSSSLDVPTLDGVIGQDRAVRSMQFGLSMDAPGYNIFVAGQPGTGKTTYVNASVCHVATKGPAPNDWCYVNNFSDTDNPIIISLPAGQGRIFQKDMNELITEFRASVPKAFESSDYEQQKNNLVEAFQNHLQEGFDTLQAEATKVNFVFKPQPGKFLLMPVHGDQTLSNEEFEKLPPEERKTIEETGHQLEKKLDEILREGKLIEKQTEEKITGLEKQITLAAADPSLNKLKEKYSQFPKITQYLEDVRKDIEENNDLFQEQEEDEETPEQSFAVQADDDADFVRYKVNLFVNHEKTSGAPVIIESSPNYYNLFGKVEYKNQLMSISTDFTMVKAGAIHRANGGYLILQAKDVLTEPLVWAQLKRALKYRQVDVENIGEQYRNIPTATLRMEPVPLKIKVILIGSPLFYLVLTQDEDFTKLFKVKVDFDIDMNRTPENLCKYVSFVSSLCQRENLLHMNRAALARMIEYGSRLAGSQDKLSTRFNEVGEIIYEANAQALADGTDLIDAHHVNRAIEERRYRSNRIEEKIQEMILQGKILIETAGSAIGKINGLSVIELGNYSFGRPSRITAVTFVGRGGVINIERETEMSGVSHTKGVLTLAGYLGAKFAKDKPLDLTAQITFEQNYDEIDGDSASSTELYAILSSLANVPLKQYLAVTGSVNQYGEIQPIGGVTEKVEGFFDICKIKGLTGDQGVIIPASNIDNLMLKDEVVDAVRDQRFHLYAVKTIEAGIEILSGLPAGQLGDDGQYPDGTVFSRVDKKLQEFHKTMAASDDDND
jgi:lon-related putative ATP-dependent protease